MSLSSFTILAPPLAIIECFNRIQSYFILKHAPCSGGDDRPNWVPCGTCSWLCPNCDSGIKQTFGQSLDQFSIGSTSFVFKNGENGETDVFMQDTKKALKYQSKARRVRKLFQTWSTSFLCYELTNQLGQTNETKNLLVR